ncbi:hypothetical protein U3516DRAFT_792058 [Neocallimastix sp. 'constans']
MKFKNKPEKNDIEKVKLKSEYANRNNVVLVMNDKDKRGRNPLLYGIEKNNIEINKWGNFSLLESTYNNNIEIVKLLIDYMNKYHIV